MCDDIKAYAVSLNIIVHTAWNSFGQVQNYKVILIDHAPIKHAHVSNKYMERTG